MRGRPAYTDKPAEKAIHSYYTKILNLMPYLVYWVDERCKLQGFNANFGELLAILSPEDCEQDPYSLIAQKLNLAPKIAEELKLADMQVIFSGEAQHQVPLSLNKTKKNKANFTINRDAIFSEGGEVIGAVISIIEQQNIQENSPQKTIKNISHSNGTQKPRVLIVEDNPTAQQVESAIFTNLNCIVDSVKTGEDAIKAFKPGKYNLVIMDIGLEDSSGYLITRNFRELEKNSKFHTAIIALTSFKPENVKDDCEFYKMEGVVGKPLTENQANQIIEHFVHNKNNSIDGFN